MMFEMSCLLCYGELTAC